MRLPEQNPLIRRLNAVTSYDFSDRDLKWKKRFLEKYDELEDKTIPISQREYEVDSQLGWVPRKGVQLTNRQGLTFTTNSMGFRALYEYSPDPHRFTILVLGDSFTYGSGADDSEVWPTILQSLDDRLQVLNLAVGGYGTDQMYLMLKRHIERFAPDLVITAVVAMDLDRSTLSFRDFQKPRFRIEDDKLVLTNTPIGELDQVADQVRSEIRFKRVFSEIRLLGAVMNALSIQLPARAATTQAGLMEGLNRKIIGETAKLCERHGVDLMLLYLPWRDELRDPDFHRPGEKFLERLGEEYDAHHLNPRSQFLASDADFSLEHYRKPAAALVAHAVYEKILSLYPEASWTADRRVRPREPSERH